MTDTLVRAVTTDGNFRAIAIDATEMMAEVAKFHEAHNLVRPFWVARCSAL
ncbi:hypothetical protein [Weissella cibaria]|uniref:hypothetical protein n=1 Tax=Weissella cibaria TaxID=137591 RepID=UPI000A629766|nr:hypothetical protein [Weissella cibaria]